MRMRSFILLAVALFAVLVGGFLYVALSGGGDERRVGALRPIYSVGRTVLFSAGQPLGYLKSASCGAVRAEASRESPELAGKGGPDPKQIGKPLYEPCKFSFGLSMEPELYTWINAAMSGKQSPRNLMVQYLNIDGKEQSTLDLNQALLTEFEMPALDAASSDIGYMTIKVDPQTIVYKAGSGAATTAKTQAAKSWLPRNFKLDWAGVSATKVTKIGSFGFEIPAGTQRPLFRELEITVPESDPSPFDKFFQTFVIEGQNAPQFEKTANVTFLDATLANTVATLALTGVGITDGVLVGGAESSADTIAKRQYTLYAEGANLSIAP